MQYKYTGLLGHLASLTKGPLKKDVIARGGDLQNDDQMMMKGGRGRAKKI